MKCLNLEVLLRECLLHTPADQQDRFRNSLYPLVVGQVLLVDKGDHKQTDFWDMLKSFVHLQDQDAFQQQIEVLVF